MSAPKIYNFHPATGEYIGEGLADPSPMEPGVWLYPAHSTETAPPAAGPGQAAIFDGESWSLVADHRGETWFTAEGQAIVIDALGDPAQLDLLPEAPPEPEPEPDPPPTTSQKITSAPSTLFGGPTLKDIFNGY